MCIEMYLYQKQKTDVPLKLTRALAEEPEDERAQRVYF